MAGHRSTIEFDVAGRTVEALTAGPPSGHGKPLIAALHGGSYTARYFDVAGSRHGTFMDLAAAGGYPVVSFNRPGYGGSSPLDPAENTFDLQARLLAAAIAQAADRFAADGVFLVGHSMGGIIALMIAAADRDFRLIGLSVTGVGAVLRPGSAAETLATLPPDEIVDLPSDLREQAMFGPDYTRTAEAVRAARDSYAPVPVRELLQAARWPRERLPVLAPRIRVPVHNALGEFDATFDNSPASVERFARLLTAAPYVDASIARATGHSIDHHILGHALHLRQLAFVEECTLWSRQLPVG
jgi:pimeloyl-ACP methyl ester carboxylesterase